MTILTMLVHRIPECFKNFACFLVRAYLGRHREFCLSPLTSDVDTETRDNSRTVPQAHRRQVKAAKDRFHLTFCGLQQDESLTQFYCVDFSQPRIGVKNCVFSSNSRSRFASVVIDAV